MWVQPHYRHHMSRIASTLLAEVEAFLTETQIAPSTFGREAIGDGHLVRNLRDGLDPKASTIDNVRLYMATSRARAGKRQGGNGGRVNAAT